MRKVVKRLQKFSNKGLTLVELICAIAILGLVGVAIGSMLIVSSNSYDKGITEVELQQEAQMVVNQISDLVIDSTVESTGTNLSFDSTTSTLVIPQGSSTHTILLRDGNLYYKFDDGSGSSTEELMTEGVTKFVADTVGFEESGNLHINIGLEKESRGQVRSYESTFHITSRNGIVEIAPVASISMVDEIVLEPGESFNDFNIRVDGIANQNVIFKGDTGDKAFNSNSATNGTKVNTGTHSIQIANDELADEVYFIVETEERNPDGTAMAIKPVRVHIRRVTGAVVSYQKVYGEDYKAGATYDVTVTMVGNNLEKMPIRNDVKADGTNNYLGNSYNVSRYDQIGFRDYSLSHYGRDEAVAPADTKYRIKLNSDIPAGSFLEIKFYSSHGDGANRGGAPYSYQPGTLRITNANTYFTPNPSGDRMQRGSDISVGQFNFQDLKKMLENLWGNGNYYPKKSFRFKVVGAPDTEWSRWVTSTDIGKNDGDNDVNFRGEFGLCMDYDKDYDIEIKLEIWGTRNGEKGVRDTEPVLLWPEAGTPESVNHYFERMAKVSGIFDSTYLNFTDQANFGSDGGTGQTAKFNKGGNSPVITVKRLYGIKEGDYDNYARYYIDSKVDGVWKNLGTVNEKNLGYQDGKNLGFDFEDSYPAGDYRVRVVLHNVPKYDINTLQKVADFDYEMYNYGSGMFYFTAEKK